MAETGDGDEKRPPESIKTKHDDYDDLPTLTDGSETTPDISCDEYEDDGEQNAQDFSPDEDDKPKSDGQDQSEKQKPAEKPSSGSKYGDLDDAFRTNLRNKLFRGSSFKNEGAAKDVSSNTEQKKVERASPARKFKNLTGFEENLRIRMCSSSENKKESLPKGILTKESLESTKRVQAADVEKPRKEDSVLSESGDKKAVLVQHGTEGESAKKKTKEVPNPKVTDSPAVPKLSDGAEENLRLGSGYLKMENYFKAAEHYDEAFEHLSSSMVSLLDNRSTFAVSFCYTLACLGCKSLTYVEKAEKEIKKLEKMETDLPAFAHLVAYIIARFHVRLNNYHDGLDQCNRAKEIISQANFKFEVLNYPGLKEAVSVTQPEEFRTKLEETLLECKFAPKPDAKCRGECNHRSVNIYCSDPGFDGYYVVSCTSNCEIAFHPSCYKLFTRKSGVDKDSQCKPCITPNCDGYLSKGTFIKKDNEVKHFTFKKFDGPTITRDTGRRTRRKGDDGTDRGRQVGTLAKAVGRSKSRDIAQKAKRDRSRIDSTTVHGTANVDEGQKGVVAKAEASLEHLIGREAYPLVRDRDIEEQPIRKKKVKKEKLRPIVVSLLPSNDKASTSGRTFCNREQAEDPESHQSDNESPNDDENFAVDVDPLSLDAAMNAGLSKELSEAIDNFLSFLYSIITSRPEKWIPIYDENLLSALNSSVELNRFICDCGDLQEFLIRYGGCYSLTADDEKVYVLETDVDDFEVTSKRFNKFGFDASQRGAAAQGVQFRGNLKTTIEHQEAKKRNDQKRIEEILDLQNQLSILKEKKQYEEIKQQRRIESLTSQIDAKRESVKTLSKQIQREQQKSSTDIREAKASMEKRSEEITGLQSRLEMKAGIIEQLTQEIQYYQKASRVLKMAVKPERSCNCLTEAEEAKRRAVAAEIAILSIQHENAVRDLKSAYGNALRYRDELLMNEERVASEAKDAFDTYVEEWEANLRQLQCRIVEVGKIYSARIMEVESGTPMASLQPVNLPQLPDEPAIPGILQNFMSGLRRFRKDVVRWTMQGELAPPGFNVTPYHQVINRVQNRFPNVNRQQIDAIIIEIRRINGDLCGFSISTLVDAVNERIARNYDSQGSADQSSTGSSDSNTCSICLLRMTPTMGDTNKLPCGHQYHAHCIRCWFQNNRVCPQCRSYSLLPEEYPSLDAN